MLKQSCCCNLRGYTTLCLFLDSRCINTVLCHASLHFAAANTPEGNAALLSDRPLGCCGENHLDLRLAVPLDHPLLGNHHQAAELELPILL